ncbi:MAG TPA: peptidase MA family metallohydrolase [Candidatus Limnocylindrales bacterium]
MRRRGLRLVAWSVIGGGLLALAAAAPTLAADTVTFGSPDASSKFGDGVSFDQPVTIQGNVARAEILIQTPGAIGPTVFQPEAAISSGTDRLRYHLDLSDGNTVPNTPITAQWRVVTGDGRSILGPKVSETYADDRYDWKTVTGDVVRVHWVEGGQAFGERALRIGDQAVKQAASLLGVTESDPIDFFIYADQDAFYQALGPATRENVGGQAHPDIRTLFALITPADIDASWVESVVPHELTHVVFQTAVDNPYHDPPHWLNEGLAVYLSDGYRDSDRRQLEAAAKDGSIMPLDGLAGAFPTSQDRFFQAYAESVSAVDRIVRVNGREALVKLIRSYHDGVSDDEAFQAALGVDLAGFERDWLAELHATVPQRVGPRAAPAGPLPEGWTGPQPNPSFDVTGSLPPQPPSAPRPGGAGDDLVAGLLGPTVGVLGIVLVFVLGVIVSGRMRRRGATSPESGWNRVYGRPVIRDDAIGDGAGDRSSDPPAAPAMPGIRFGPDADRDPGDGAAGADGAEPPLADDAAQPAGPDPARADPRSPGEDPRSPAEDSRSPDEDPR